MKKKKRSIRRASAVIAFILLTSIAFLSAVFTLGNDRQPDLSKQPGGNSGRLSGADWFLSGSRNFFRLCKL